MLAKRPMLSAALFALVAGLILTLPARSDEQPNTDKLGIKIANIGFKDGTAKAFELHSLKERKAYVIVFLNFDCPVSRSYADTLAQLAKTYADKGVTFIGICTNDDLTTEQLTKE